MVDKLPRSEEEGAQEVMGASALMNRRIKTALMEWKRKPWRLHFCSKGTVLRNVYEIKPYRTIADLNENNRTIVIFQSSSESKTSLESSIFEKHALQLVSDARYALRLEQDFKDDEEELLLKNKRTGADREEEDDYDDDDEILNDDETTVDNPSARTSRKNRSMKRGGTSESRSKLHKKAVNAAIQRAVTGISNSGSNHTTAMDSSAAGNSTIDFIQRKQLNSSLTDLIDSITNQYTTTTGLCVYIWLLL